MTLSLPQRSPTTWRYWLKITLILLTFSLVVTVLQFFGWLTPFESTSLDTFFALNSVRSPSQDVVLVVINDGDYTELFNGTSPLAPAAVQRLVERLAAAGPRAIGVDLDTSAPAWAGYQPSLDVPVVWAREATFVDGEIEFQFRVLGRDNPDVPRGIAAAPVDADGVIRRYSWYFDSGGTRAPSFAGAILAAAGETRAGQEATRLNFFGDRYEIPRFNASDVLALEADGDWQRYLQDRIVLIGATFRASRDVYRAPWSGEDQQWFGVEVMANVVEAELRGAGIRPISFVSMMLIELLVGLSIVWICHHLSLGPALLLNIGVASMGAPLASLLVFSTFAYWGSFLPFLTATLLQQLYEQAIEYRELWRRALDAGERGSESDLDLPPQSTEPIERKADDA